MELKALKILKELQSSKVYKFFCKSRVEESIAELEALIEKDKSKKCEECYRETNKVLALVEQRESDAKHTIIKLIRELETLENQDKLAELEKVILDCYLVQGYQIGVGGWAFKVNISTLHKTKEIQIMFRENIYSDLETIFRTDAKTTKEMFDKAIDFFNLWSSKILELQNDKRR